MARLKNPNNFRLFSPIRLSSFKKLQIARDIITIQKLNKSAQTFCTLYRIYTARLFIICPNHKTSYTVIFLVFDRKCVFTMSSIKMVSSSGTSIPELLFIICFSGLKILKLTSSSESSLSSCLNKSNLEKKTIVTR